ncbi:hypothetical protein LTR56_000637 [Elasticomyces elasticus]|nr:hypothetical protein LTR56_000637 [Elasticomyces elasticus]KAK3664414.1 hypothetical protein LTR22_004827 [Elasticomyces elasticus]KAK4919416.1 hypothetical protein LTR49_012950 [Elasticomyces elasticus]KAK5758290.1 hypothetical protein LTS12_011613 [Elasticomyces elasticus]
MLNVQYIILDKLEFDSAFRKAFRAGWRLVLDGSGVTQEDIFRFIRSVPPGDLATWAVRNMPKKLVEVYGSAPYTLEAIMHAAHPSFPTISTHGDAGNYLKRLPRHDPTLPSGSYTGVAGIGNDGLDERGSGHLKIFRIAKNNPQYIPPPKGSRDPEKRKPHESAMYQFYAWSGVSAIETVNLLAVDREDHSLPAEDALGPALLLMEGTFGPLNGSTSPKHSYSRDSRYRAVLPPALLASFGLAGSQPLSALSGPLKTVPFAVGMPPRSTLACSTNLAPRLLRGAIVPTATQEKHAPAFRLATSRSPMQPHPEVTNAMVKHGWTPETDDVFFALDVSPSYHPTNFAGLAEQELRPNYEHAGNIALELFYFAAKTETIRSVFLPYRHKCASRYSSAMAAQTLYEAAHEEVVPSNRRIETLSGGIAFEGHSLGPDVLQ